MTAERLLDVRNLKVYFGAGGRGRQAGDPRGVWLVFAQLGGADRRR